MAELAEPGAKRKLESSLDEPESGSISPKIKCLQAKNDTRQNAFYRQIKLSPDELCFSATKNDPKLLEIYNFGDPSISNFDPNPCIQIHHGWNIYDHVWYPHFNSSYPETCLILTCSAGQGSQVKLFDAYSSGDLISTFEIRCQYDEPAPTYAVEFSHCGNFIFCGRDSAITCFDVNKNKFEDSFTIGKKPENFAKKFIKNNPSMSKNLLSGIQSVIKSHPTCNNMLASGSFSGHIALLDARTNKIPCQIKSAHPKGINSLKWRNQFQLLSGSRQSDNTIRLWDLRMTADDKFLNKYQAAPTEAANISDWEYYDFEAQRVLMRKIKTHQKYEFDLLDSNTLITGGENSPTGGYPINGTT